MNGPGRVPAVRQAVVLAGGRGTRLGALTRDTPKPLLPVAGRPFLEWLLLLLAEQGVEEAVLTVGYRADAFRGWRASADPPVKVALVEEDEPLGTWGAVPRLLDRLDPVFALLNGDTILDVPLRRLAAVLSEAGTGAAMALRRVDDASRFGAVELDGPRVVAFREKAETGPGWINGGVYLMRREVAARFPGPGPMSVERDVLPALVEGRELAALEVDGFFLDIGVPDTYDAAQRLVPAWWQSRGQSAPRGGA